MSHRKTKKRLDSRAINTVLLSMCIVLAVALAAVSLYALQHKKSTRDINTIEKLLMQDTHTIPGYACGIFSQADAQDFLAEAEETDRKILNVTTPARWNGDDDITLRYADGCYYEASNKSTVYAQIVFESFPDNNIAQLEFERSLPLVAEPIYKDGLVRGSQKVTYDAGVHYILKDRQIIQIAASNGTASESEQFSEELVKRLELRL